MAREILVHLNVEVNDDANLGRLRSMYPDTATDAEALAKWIVDGISIHVEANEDLGIWLVVAPLAEEI